MHPNNTNDSETRIAHIRKFDQNRRENRKLKMIVLAFVVLTILLVGTIFGTSLLSAHLSKAFSVDPSTGIVWVENGHGGQILKTEPALAPMIGVSPVTMENNELRRITNLLINNGDIQFSIQGYARDSTNNKVVLLVQGGTIEFDAGGIASATGDAAIILAPYNSTFESGNRRMSTAMQIVAFIGFLEI